MSSSRIRLSLFPLVFSGWLFAFWLTVGISAAKGETGEVHHLPMPPDKPDHGLILQIDSRWIDGSGYRPVRVTVGMANGLPAPADRRLQVTLQPHQYMFSSELTSVTQEVELPQGSASATTSVLIPQQSAWYGISLEVREDGRKLDELSNNHLSTYSSYYGNIMTEAYPATIVFHRNAPVRNQRANWIVDQANRLDSGEEVDEFPDLRILFNEQTIPTSTPLKSQLTGSPYQAVSALQYLPRTDLLPLADVPDTWLGLSSADLLVFELQDLQTLHSTSPEKIAAVRDWVLAGGNLLVWNAGEQGTSQIDQWFGLEQESADQWTEFSLDAARTNDLGLLRTLRRPRNNYGMVNVNSEYSPLAIKDGKLVETSDRNSGNAPTVEKPLMLASRELGYGMMLLVEEEPFPGNLTTWDHLFGSIGGSRLAWFERHGMSRIRENLGFWDFLVPGVGVAPVTTFEVLITLFVILIGPVNYFFLRAISRLNLLIVTVPAGAFLITGLLMIYAVVSDGLSTQTRIRSLTTLDQTTGLGATWSRQAYYSGLASSAGLAFPTDAAVFEYEQFPLTENHSQKRLAWGKQQVLSGGYFRSRVTQQFLAIRPYSTERQLKVDTSGNSVSVTNQLGTKILALMVVDENGTPHFGKNVEAEAQANLRPNDSEAANQIRALVGGGNLGVPDGFDRQMYIRRANQRRYYSSYSNIPEQHQVEPTFAHALMERKLQAQLISSFTALGPRSYVAIVERFPETPIGIEIPSGEKSLEVIQATW